MRRYLWNTLCKSSELLYYEVLFNSIQYVYEHFLIRWLFDDDLVGNSICEIYRSIFSDVTRIRKIGLIESRFSNLDGWEFQFLNSKLCKVPRKIFFRALCLSKTSHVIKHTSRTMYSIVIFSFLFRKCRTFLSNLACFIKTLLTTIILRSFIAEHFYGKKF